MLDSVTIQKNLLALFCREVDWKDSSHLQLCEYTVKNLAMHYIDTTLPQVINLIRFDDLKLQMMMVRFHRDAFGVYNYISQIKLLCPDPKVQESILNDMELLSIRINSDKPRVTRIVAAFSLWMSTFRPIYFAGLPSNPIKDLWRLEAEVNFYIAVSYLSLFGQVQVGIEGKDREIRLERIYYDFTFRDINLSSLEMLYCSIFRPVTKVVKLPVAAK